MKKIFTVIGIVHKDAHTPYGIDFPGLHDPIFELVDSGGSVLEEAVSAFLKEYFTFMAAASIKPDDCLQSKVLRQQPADDPSRTGHTESVVTINGVDITVQTEYHPLVQP